ncbi:hypothetical protein [Solitalea koreensis]|uniref:hypothetical protein n=1 Tax=Solitalea koreensis TaxID=543615 RepID=UPI00163D6B82|nr:hypothetical protein [Solitalea koreensis]
MHKLDKQKTAQGRQPLVAIPSVLEKLAPSANVITSYASRRLPVSGSKKKTGHG